MIVLTYLFALLGITSAVLANVSFTREQRERYPILAGLERKQQHLFIASLVFCGIALGAIILKDVPGGKPALVLIRGPRGGFAQKATSTGFKRELEGAAAERVSEAQDYFNTAERDLAARRYRDAASNYQQSINVLSTMPGYLNLAVSLVYVLDFRQVEGHLFDGIQIARKKGDRKFEGAFLDVIGIVYATQGKLEEALKIHHGALEIAKQICDPLGQAVALGNIGEVYRQQRKLEAALKSYEAALGIFKGNDSHLGHAMTLDAISVVYADQGKLEEALKIHHGALEIAKQIADPLN